MNHGISCFLIPFSFDILLFLLPKLKLPVEGFDGHERVLHGGLHGNPELALLLAKLKGDHLQNLWEFPQDLQRKEQVRSGTICLGGHPIRAYQPEKECGYGEGSKSDFLIRNEYTRGHLVTIH